MNRSNTFLLLSGAAVCLVLLAAGYFLFVGTSWGQAFDNAGYFGHAGADRVILDYDTHILGRVSKQSLLVVMFLLLVVAIFRQRVLLGFAAIGGLACAVVGAELLKHHLTRHDLAPPGEPVPSYFVGDTYPSGHTSIGTSVALALLLVAPARWRPWLSPLAGLMSASYGTAVLFAGWHRPSDAVGGVLWSTVCLSLAAAAILRLVKIPTAPGAPERRALFLSAGCAVVSLVVAALTTGWLGSHYPEADVPFLSMTALIILSAFAATAWFGWVLQRAE